MAAVQDVERSGSGMFYNIIPAYAWRNWEKLWKLQS